MGRKRKRRKERKQTKLEYKTKASKNERLLVDVFSRLVGKGDRTFAVVKPAPSRLLSEVDSCLRTH